MDPLSISVSILAIATAAAKISRTISLLRAFGEVPRRLYGVKNEVSDLEVVLRQVADSCQQQSLAPGSDQDELRQLLDRIKERLAELASGLERLAAACPKGKANIISKTRVWAKEKGLFERLQSDLQAIKESLSLTVGVSNSHNIRHILLELRQVGVLAMAMGKAHQYHAASMTGALEDHHMALSGRLDEQYRALSSQLDMLGKYILKDQVPSEKGATDNSSETPGLRVSVAQRAPCRNWCPCACHTKKSARMTLPGIVESVIGSMFVSYTGLPILNNACDFQGCRDQQKASAAIEYWFPWWLLAKNMKMQFKYLPNAGPQLQLATTRRVPDTALSIAYARQGNMEGLKYLCREGLASPRDVSASRGFTLMRWALYGGMHQYETVKFLLHQGAQVDDECYDHVWDFSFRNKVNQGERQELRCITESDERDWVEEQNFPLIHRIIFGLSSKSLAAETEENPNAIYVKDSQGRTALDWATARAQLDDMHHLIAQGSDVNSMDATGRTTVLHAVDSHNDEALRIVLEAGANPNPKMPKGLFRSSPLTSSGFGGLAGMLRLLLKHGAEPDACNPEGATALHNVANTQNVECALILLEWGADLNIISSNGRTPLTTAIINNNHPVLSLFVNRCYEYIATARFKGPQLLPIIAEHADLKSLGILASSHPLKLALDLSAEGMTTSRQILRTRRDFDEKLSLAFEELLTIAVAEEVEADSPTDSAVESGLFFSARSSFRSDLAEAIAQLESVEEDADEDSDSWDEASTETEKPPTYDQYRDSEGPHGDAPTLGSHHNRNRRSRIRYYPA